MAIAEQSLDLSQRCAQHRPDLVRLCRQLLGPGGDAEDAAHEALLKAWAAHDRFDPARPLWPWLAAIARNVCIDQQRHRTMARTRAPRESPAPAGPEDVVMGRAHGGLVRDAILDLPAGAREVLLLHDVHQLDYAEIAARQQRSPGAIRTAVSRARSDLRERVEVLARSRGAWPLSALTGGIGARRAGRFRRGWVASQRRAAELSTPRTDALLELARRAEEGTGRAVVGGVLAMLAVLQPGAGDDPARPDPTRIEVHVPGDTPSRGGGGPGAGAPVDRTGALVPAEPSGVAATPPLAAPAPDVQGIQHPSAPAAPTLAAPEAAEVPVEAAVPSPTVPAIPAPPVPEVPPPDPPVDTP